MRIDSNLYVGIAIPLLSFWQLKTRRLKEEMMKIIINLIVLNFLVSYILQTVVMPFALVLRAFELIVIAR